MSAASPPATSLRVRPARRSDLPHLRLIWLELMHMHAQSDASFELAADGVQRWQHMAEDMLDRDDTFVHVAVEVDESLPLGFCLGWVARNPPIYKIAEVGFVSEIAVSRHMQRRGIGRALIADARAWFLGHRLREFQLSTAVWNEAAKAFWEAVGGKPLLVRYRFDV